MTQEQAYQIVRDTYNDDPMDGDELEALFEAIYERAPDQDDRDVGLWSLVCAGTTGCCGCDTRLMHEAGGCRPSALSYRDPAYHQGLHDGYESSDAILHAIEQVTGADLLDESYECFYCPLTGESPEAVQDAHAEGSPCRAHLSFFDPVVIPNAAQARWQDDPDGQVAQYLAAHFAADEGDTLDWGAGSLTYTDGAWA